MKSQRAQEGWLYFENRHAPAPDNSHPVFSGAVVECPTYTCSHCNRVVIMNPDRVRERAFCGKCSHRICDQCEAVRVASGGECKPFVQLLDEAEDRILKGQPVGELPWLSGPSASATGRPPQ